MDSLDDLMGSDANWALSSIRYGFCTFSSVDGLVLFCCSETDFFSETSDGFSGPVAVFSNSVGSSFSIFFAANAGSLAVLFVGSYFSDSIRGGVAFCVMAGVFVSIGDKGVISASLSVVMVDADGFSQGLNIKISPLPTSKIMEKKMINTRLFEGGSLGERTFMDAVE